MLKNKRNTYYIDTEYNNMSFYTMYETLKNEGIKNNKFFLALYNRDLLEIDPYDKNLTKEEKAMILYEVKNNFWYFIRRVVLIQSTGSLVPFKLHLGNLALFWSLLNNINTSLMLPRQNYKSFSACTFYCWLYNFGTMYSETCFIGLDYDSTMMNLERLKGIKKALPQYLQINSKYDTDQLKKVSSEITGNRIICKGAARTPKAASKLGRGNTQATQWYDEIAFINFNSIIHNAATPAQSEASDAARKHGKPYHKLFTTTPSSLLTDEGVWSKSMIDKAAKFDIKLFDFTKKELANYIDKNSENNFLHIELSYKQIGRSEKWFRRQCKELAGDVKAIKQEILLQWSRGVGTGLYTEEEIDRLYQHIVDPVGHLMINEYYLFDFYKIYDPNEYVLIGIDSAAGVSEDNSAITIVNPLTLEVIADFSSPIIDTHDFANLIYVLASRYFRNCCLIIENNNYGKGIIDILAKTDIEHKMYYEDKRVKGQAKVKKDYGYHETNTTKDKVYGTNTNVTSRDIIISLTTDIVKDDYKKINSKKIVDDIAGLERKNNGKIEHSSASHDDNLFSYLFVRYVWSYGINLARFNIFKPSVLVKDPNSAEDNELISEFIQNQKKLIKDISNANANYSKFAAISPNFRNALNTAKQIEKNKKEAPIYEENTVIIKRNSIF